MNNELETIKKFLLTLHKRCDHYNKCGCANSNICGMANYCHKGFRLADNEIEQLYRIYLKDENEYLDELELAKKIKEFNIDYKKIEKIIDAMKYV